MSRSVLINNKGFTLLSSLMAVSITSLTILLILSLSGIILRSDQFERAHQRSVYIFLNQIGREIHGGSNFYCEGDGLMFSSGNDSIYYHKEGDRIIREVNFLGYDIALQNVSAVQFKCPGSSEVDIAVNPGWPSAISWSEESEIGISDAP